MIALVTWIGPKLPRSSSARVAALGLANDLLSLGGARDESEIPADSRRDEQAWLGEMPRRGDETLYALDRAFDLHRIVLLHAYAGSGKTATSAEFARWYALTGGVEGPVLLTSFERRLPLARVLDQKPDFGGAIEQLHALFARHAASSRVEMGCSAFASSACVTCPSSPR